MAKYDELPVYKASYDLLIEIFRFAKENANLLMQWILLCYGSAEFIKLVKAKPLIIVLSVKIIILTLDINNAECYYTK